MGGRLQGDQTPRRPPPPRRRAARAGGGGGRGAGVWGFRELARRLDAPARIVTLFPDSGFRYLSTIYNDGWMRNHGFL